MTDKVSKKEAQYTPWSKVPGQQCSGCTMIRPAATVKTSPWRCTAVNGAIAPGGWCKFFKAKEKI